jgi:acyl transferase domain-containing protein
VGGVIKMTMAMRHGLLPKTLHVDRPSRFIDWSSGAMSLLLEPVPWVKENEPRRAAVHSFGASGTNVHVILEEPPPLAMGEPTSQQRAPLKQVDGAPVPWPISGHGEEGLRLQAQRLAEFLAERPELGIADIGCSLAARPALSHRAAPIGTSRAELLASVEGLAAGHAAAAPTDVRAVAPGIDVHEAPPDSAPPDSAPPDSTSPEPLSAEALSSLSQIWVAGGTVDWQPAFAALDARPVRLPTYAFARRRHWVEHSPMWEHGGPLTQLGLQLSQASDDPLGSPSLQGGVAHGEEIEV